MADGVILTAGGTGGHLYPAQGLAGHLRRAGHDPFFIGSGLKKSPFFEKGHFDFAEVSSAPLSKKRPWGAIPLGWGTLQALRVLKKRKPKVVVGFGGYASAPALFAAVMARIPIVLHEGNAVPGRVTRFFSRWAKQSVIHLPPAAGLLQGEVVEAAMPLRFPPKRARQEEALHHFGLGSDRFTLLVFGGSQGAARLNRAFTKSLGHYPPHKLQVIHLTGEETAQYEAIYARLGIPAAVRKFEKRIDLAWSCADLALMRAGAGSVAEQIEWEVPAILVPYPHARDGHQEANARFVSEEIGGAITLTDHDYTPAHIADALHQLVHHAGEMRYALRQYRERPRKQLLDIVEAYL